MASDPVVRERVLSRLRSSEGGVMVGAPHQLRVEMGMQDVSSTQFKRALNSLIYNPRHGRLIQRFRPPGDTYGPRPIKLRYRS